MVDMYYFYAFFQNKVIRFLKILSKWMAPLLDQMFSIVVVLLSSGNDCGAMFFEFTQLQMWFAALCLDQVVVNELVLINAYVTRQTVID